MQPDTVNTTQSSALASQGDARGRAVAVASKSRLVISEPVSILGQSLVVSAALWAFLLYFGLLMFAFLWSFAQAGEAYAWIFDTKAINWIITAVVITGIALHVLRLRALRELRNPSPVYYPPSTAASPPEKGGVYGRARSARDEEIDSALRGHTGGFKPMFED